MEEQTSSATQPQPQPQPQPQRIVYVHRVERKNKIGTAGFVFAMLALFFGAIPVLGWIFWLLGIIFSSVGLGRNPKGLSPAGLIVSIFSLFLIIIVTVLFWYYFVELIDSL